MKKIKVKKEETAKKEIKSPFFTVSFAFTDWKVKTKGLDIVDCLNQITPKFTLKSKATVTIKSGKKSCSRVMLPVEIKRLLSKDFNKVVFQKRMLTIMK